MPLFEITTKEQIDRMYRIEAASEAEALTIFEHNDYEDNQEFLVCDDSWDGEEIIHVSLWEAIYPSHWTSDEHLAADDIRRQLAPSEHPDPTNDELETMVTTMQAQ